MLHAIGVLFMIWFVCTFWRIFLPVFGFLFMLFVIFVIAANTGMINV